LLHDISEWCLNIFWDERAALRACAQDSSHATKTLIVCQIVKMHFQLQQNYLSKFSDKMKKYSDEVISYQHNH
jgi:hypothetical protein